MRLNPLSVATDRSLDQSLEDEVFGAGSGGLAYREAKTKNGKRAQLGEEFSWLGSGATP
jgi:hypothetical protein